MACSASLIPILGLALLIAVFECLIVALGTWRSLLFPGWAGGVFVADGAAILHLADELLEIIIDGVIVERLTLTEQMTDHHTLGDGHIYVALWLSALDEPLNESDAILAGPILLEPVANRHQLFICVHSPVPFRRYRARLGAAP